MRTTALNLGIALFLACLVNACGGALPVRIEGTAMLPAFRDGDKIIMRAVSGDLQRGEVIMFRYPKDEKRTYFKRVIGLPGETIEIKTGVIYINGSPVDEPYLDQEYNHVKPSFPPEQIPSDHYFVMGDNRDNSSDSRSWGTVDKRLIVGKYYMTYSKSEK